MNLRSKNFAVLLPLRQAKETHAQRKKSIWDVAAGSGHPAVNNDLSGDGSSIVFMTDGWTMRSITTTFRQTN